MSILFFSLISLFAINLIIFFFIFFVVFCQKNWCNCYFIILKANTNFNKKQNGTKAMSIYDFYLKKLDHTLFKEVKTIKDAQMIKSFLEEMPFFSDFHDQYFSSLKPIAFVEMLKTSTTEIHKKNTYIYKQGNPLNQKAYIILKGQVRLLHGTNKPDRSAYVNVALSQKLKMLVHAINFKIIPIIRIAQCSRYEKNKDPVQEKAFSSNEELRVYKAGEIFSRIVFTKSIPKNYLRTNSAYCESDVIVLILSRREYLIINDLFDRVKLERTDFFGKIFPEINKITSQIALEGIILKFFEKKFKKNEFITFQNFQGKFIYFVKEGEVELSNRFLPLEENNKQKRTDYRRPVLVPVARVVQGQFFGEEILLNNPPIYNSNSKIVSENAVLYYISLRDTQENLYMSMINKLIGSAKLKVLSHDTTVDKMIPIKLQNEPLLRKTLFEELGKIKKQVRPTHSMIKKQHGTRSLQKLPKIEDVEKIELEHQKKIKLLKDQFFGFGKEPKSESNKPVLVRFPTKLQMKIIKDNSENVINNNLEAKILQFEENKISNVDKVRFFYRKNKNAKINLEKEDSALNDTKDSKNLREIYRKLRREKEDLFYSHARSEKRGNYSSLINSSKNSIHTIFYA